MLPAGLLTVITPSATVHFAGDLSLVATHSSRFFPSNRMMASAGAVHVEVAGATTLGTGSQTSVSSGRGFCVAFAGACWATSGSVSAPSKGSARRRDDLMSIDRKL